MLQRVRALLSRHSGLHLPDWVVEARIGERASALGMPAADRYVNLLVRDQEELEQLVESLRVGETSFFRHHGQMKALADEVAPTLVAAGRKRVRVWSAGCASGEEPYSVAMVLRHALPADVALSVLASDISGDALEAAELRVYPSEAVTRVPAPIRGRYFEREDDDKVRVASEIAELVRFERRNLADRPYPGSFDVILCRNVLIYFSADARHHAVRDMIDSLRPGGYMLVGYSESLRSFDALEAIRCPEAVVYRRPPAEADTDALPTLESAPPPPPARAAAPKPAPAEPPHLALSGRYEDGDGRLSRQLAELLSSGTRRVEVDVDGADYLGDGAGVVLRRALAAAAASGIEVFIRARRPGTQRWLRRLGITVEAEG